MQFQTISCKCGATFAACLVPECYVDKDWQKELRKYASQNCIVDLKNQGEWQFGACSCKKIEETNLFNQP